MDPERKIRLLGREIDPKTMAVVGLGAGLFGCYILHKCSGLFRWSTVGSGSKNIFQGKAEEISSLRRLSC
jgi:hypothetical protein